MKKHLFLLLFIIILSTNLFSQNVNNYNLNENKYFKYDLKDYLNYQSQNIDGLYFGYGLQKPLFLNSNFGNNVEQDNLKYRYGHFFDLTMKFYPFSIQSRIFSTYYKSEQLEFSSHLALFPFFPKNKQFSSFFVPFVGLGIHYSQLTLIDNRFKFWSTISNTNLFGIMGKTGINLNFSPEVSFTFEYSKSLNLKEKNFNQVFAILYIKINYEY